MKRTGKSISVKEWFANKMAQEIGRNISRCDVFGIIKESEKAVYALVDLGTAGSKTTWIPKSCLIEAEVGIGDDAQGYMHWDTYRFENYDEARAEFRRFKEQFI